MSVLFQCNFNEHHVDTVSGSGSNGVVGIIDSTSWIPFDNGYKGLKFTSGGCTRIQYPLSASSRYIQFGCKVRLTTAFTAGNASSRTILDWAKVADYTNYRFRVSFSGNDHLYVYLVNNGNAVQKAIQKFHVPADGEFSLGLQAMADPNDPNGSIRMVRMYINGYCIRSEEDTAIKFPSSALDTLYFGAEAGSVSSIFEGAIRDAWIMEGERLQDYQFLRIHRENFDPDAVSDETVYRDPYRIANYGRVTLNYAVHCEHDGRLWGTGLMANGTDDNVYYTTDLTGRSGWTQFGTAPSDGNHIRGLYAVGNYVFVSVSGGSHLLRSAIASPSWANNLALTDNSGIYGTKARDLDATSNQRFEPGTTIDPTISDFWCAGWVLLQSGATIGKVVYTGAAANGQDGFSLDVDSAWKPRAAINDSVEVSMLRIEASDALVADKWYFLLMTVDRDGDLTLYVKPSSDWAWSDTAAASADCTAHNDTLGSTKGGGEIGNVNQTGGICMVAYGEGSLPTTGMSGEMAELYNNGAGMLHSQLSAGLAAKVTHYWDGQENSGNLIDQEGANNASPVNAPGTRASMNAGALEEVDPHNVRSGNRGFASYVDNDGTTHLVICEYQTPGTNSRIMYTDDFGASWTERYSRGTGLANRHMHGVYYADSGRLWACYGDKSDDVGYSDDHGANWTWLMAGPANYSGRQQLYHRETSNRMISGLDSAYSGVLAVAFAKDLEAIQTYRDEDGWDSSWYYIGQATGDLYGGPGWAIAVCPTDFILMMGWDHGIAGRHDAFYVLDRSGTVCLLAEDVADEGLTDHLYVTTVGTQRIFIGNSSFGKHISIRGGRLYRMDQYFLIPTARKYCLEV